MAFTALAVNAGAQPSSAAASAPEPAASVAMEVAAALTAADGRRIYTSFCTRCHGINLVTTGSAYFDLRTFPPADKERFLRSVSKGQRAMPAWESTLKPEQMEALWLYMGSVNGWSK